MFKVDMNLWFLKDFSDEIVTDTKNFWNVFFFQFDDLRMCFSTLGHSKKTHEIHHQKIGGLK